MRGSGDGWVWCDQGHQHWGRFGAAGLLLRRTAEPDAPVLLQLRAGWSHHGGRWGVPGGARDDHETPLAAALRETREETAVPAESVRPEAIWSADHGSWSYTTVVGVASGPVEARPVGGESDAVRWIPDAEVDSLPLHPGFAAAWPTLRTVRPAAVLVVDAANTIGSEPDGWWRDRAGAVGRLRDALGASRSSGLDLTDPLGGPPVRQFPEIVLVVEGAARGVTAADGVEVVAAPGSGDDAIVDTAAARAGGVRPVVVVTADRELRRRVEPYAATWGPRRLRAQLALPPPADPERRR